MSKNKRLLKQQCIFGRKREFLEKKNLVFKKIKIQWI